MSYRTEQLAAMWAETFGTGFWHELSDEDLYAIANWLWANHLDALQEWSRRQMRNADPKPR